MKKQLLVVIILVCTSNLFGQSIDSASAVFKNDSLIIYVEGQVINWDHDALKKISTSQSGDSVLIDIFLKPCSPFQMFAPYDTSFIINGPFSPGTHHIRIFGILHRDTVGSCYGVQLNHIIADTAFLSFNVPLGVREYSEPPLTVFPNPTSGGLSLAGFNFSKADSVEIIAPSGALVKKLSTQEMDISELKRGIYYLRIAFKQGWVIRKIIKI